MSLFPRITQSGEQAQKECAEIERITNNIVYLKNLYEDFSLEDHVTEIPTIPRRKIP